MNDENKKNLDRLIKGSRELGIELTDKQIDQFITYYELLIEWNKVMNLTAITDFYEVIEKHFIDSLSLIKIIDIDKQKILDLGTGAGFPGIPLKIAFPETDIVLLDSLNKRINFLGEVIDKLGLEQISTIHGRAEDFGHDTLYRESFDLCLSRAVAKLSSLSEYCLPFVKVGGYFISYKSGMIDEEIKLSENAIKILSGQITDIKSYCLPGTDIERSLIQIEKINRIKKKYPRSAGKPTKNPL